ncbi:MAG: hypothetical protein IT426_17435 [Pirellulales bacterium]|nr:hypothetical protein [Pirellulales bacterium]
MRKLRARRDSRSELPDFSENREQLVGSRRAGDARSAKMIPAPLPPRMPNRKPTQKRGPRQGRQDAKDRPALDYERAFIYGRIRPTMALDKEVHSASSAWQPKGTLNWFMTGDCPQERSLMFILQPVIYQMAELHVKRRNGVLEKILKISYFATYCHIETYDIFLSAAKWP